MDQGGQGLTVFYREDYVYQSWKNVPVYEWKRYFIYRVVFRNGRYVHYD